jgi:tetratricopeptide (TPR) repeat protein
MRPPRLIALALVLAACLAAVRPSAQQTLTTVDLLDRYAKGEFAVVEARLAALEKFTGLVKDLKHDDVKKWLDAGGPTDRDRRELAAATFALEAARADQWNEWKWIQNQGAGKLPVLYWKPPPLLIEWGCELLRQHEEPLPIERIWQLAAMAVAQRGEDTQFLIGFTEVDGPPLPPPPAPASATAQPSPPSAGIGGVPFQSTLQQRFPDEVLNVGKEIGHLNHVAERFPREKRFMLGQALARERPEAAGALKVYSSLLTDLEVGGEAAVRMGALYLRRGDVSSAIERFDLAERITRNPDLIYLARYHRGQALLRSKKDADAMAAFRAALVVRPASQSASVALAALLAKADRRAEAQDLMKAVLDAGPNHTDPNIEYMHGDDRFWPYLLTTLRREIKK